MSAIEPQVEGRGPHSYGPSHFQGTERETSRSATGVLHGVLCFDKNSSVSVRRPFFG